MANNAIINNGMRQVAGSMNVKQVGEPGAFSGMPGQGHIPTEKPLFGLPNRLMQQKVQQSQHQTKGQQSLMTISGAQASTNASSGAGYLIRGYNGSA